MSVSQITNASPPIAAAQKHRGSISSKLSDMESALTDGLKSGKLSANQATALQKSLDSIKKETSQNQNSATGYIAPDESKKIRNEIQSLGKQLYSTLSATTQNSTDSLAQFLNSDSSSSSSSSTDFSAIFSSMKASLASGDKTKVNSDMKLYLAQMQMNSFYTPQGNSNTSTNSGSLVSFLA